MLCRGKSRTSSFRVIAELCVEHVECFAHSHELVFSFFQEYYCGDERSYHVMVLENGIKSIIKSPQSVLRMQSSLELLQSRYTPCFRSHSGRK